MTYTDDFNIRTTSVKFNDVADAIDGVITRQYTTTTGTSSAYIANPTPAWTSYTTSAIIIVTPHVTNALGATIQLNALAAKEMRIGGVPITAGVLQTGVPTILAYTGTYFEVLLQNVSIPTGQITAYAGSAAPAGWLLCDGEEYPIATYPTLSGVIGTTYNLGTETVDYFRVPDLRRRYPAGKGTSDTLGNAEGGTKAGTAYASRTMSHTHTVKAHYHGMGTGATLSVDISHTHSSGSAVSGSIGGAGDGVHRHSIPNRSGNANVGNASVVYVLRGGDTGQGGSTGATLAGTDEGGHSHTFSLTAAGQTLSSTPKTPTGTIGLVTGGVDGNTAQQTEATTQSHLFVNYIIKT